jgi:hypothetical protein
MFGARKAPSASLYVKSVVVKMNVKECESERKLIKEAGEKKVSVIRENLEKNGGETRRRVSH